MKEQNGGESREKGRYEREGAGSSCIDSLQGCSFHEFSFFFFFKLGISIHTTFFKIFTFIFLKKIVYIF